MLAVIGQNTAEFIFIIIMVLGANETQNLGANNKMFIFTSSVRVRNNDELRRDERDDMSLFPSLVIVTRHSVFLISSSSFICHPLWLIYII